MAKTSSVRFSTRNFTFLTYVALISNISTCRSEPPPSSGFTIDLIHRDSPQSPSYNPSLSPSQRLGNTLRRSFDRAQRFNPNGQLVTADIVNAAGEYLMKYSIGMPPVPALGVADTGSDVVWTQCQPCKKCFNQSVPLFQPKKSSTYRKIPCNSIDCKSLKETSCSRTTKSCVYSETYGDGSFSQGELATDTFTLASGGKGVSVPNIRYGCGFRNGVVFEGGESGIVGLGGGKASFVQQLGLLAQGKFSYCLAPLSDTSKPSRLNFGANAGVSGRGVVTTPLANRSPDTFYYLTLLGISVGNQRLELDNNKLADSGFQQEGNIIIDSGTTLTLLPTELYLKLEKAVQASIKLKAVKDPEGVLELCYATRNDVQVPSVVFHFKGGDVRLNRDNVFVRVSDTLVCLAAKPVQNLAIYGNIAQINFLVGYDLVKRTVSFKAADCAKS